MRSNQKNNRSRGRGNNNNRNKNSNPLTRSYDSNGPDVRVRGNASTVAEKYVQLARDANSAGDSVAAENFLQHAEHYFRLISAAQAQQLAQQQAQQAQQAARAENQGNRPDNRQEIRPDKNQENQLSSSGETLSEHEKPKGESDDKSVQSDMKAAEAVEGSLSENTDVKPPKRERRPRRRSVSEKTNEAKSSTGDPAGSPQPDVGELPAFVTADSDSSAAE